MRTILILLILFMGCSTEPETIHGCLDSQACNYNSSANIDNNSCEYESDCAGVCGGDALSDNCDICDSDSTNDCVRDCVGIWGGNSEINENGHNCNDVQVLEDFASINTDLNETNYLDVGVWLSAGSEPPAYEGQSWNENGRLTSLCFLCNINATDEYGNIIITTPTISNIPSSIINLDMLSTLRVENCDLNPLPTEFYYLENLDTLHINNDNSFSSIPEEFCNLYQNLDEFSFWSNKICGELPSCLQGVDIGTQNCP